MTLLRACLDCGAPSLWSRCAHHRKARTRVRTANRQRARQIIAASPRCVVCGATNDLTSDHVQPLARGGSNAGPQRVLCRSCNSRLGGRLSDNPRPRGRQ